MAAATAAAELGPANRDDFDAGLAQQRVGVGVAIIGDDDSRLQGNDVIAVVPLLAFGLVGVAAGADDMQFLLPERMP